MRSAWSLGLHRRWGLDRQPASPFCFARRCCRRRAAPRPCLGGRRPLRSRIRFGTRSGSGSRPSWRSRTRCGWTSSPAASAAERSRYCTTSGAGAPISAACPCRGWPPSCRNSTSPWRPMCSTPPPRWTSFTTTTCSMPSTACSRPRTWCCCSGWRWVGTASTRRRPSHSRRTRGGCACAVRPTRRASYFWPPSKRTPFPWAARIWCRPCKPG